MVKGSGRIEIGSSYSHGSTSSSPEWVIDIQNHLKEKPPCNSDELLCNISRVPPNMRMVDEDNYIPKLVSIGPFHRNNPILQEMEAHKLRFLCGILDPSSPKAHNVESSLKNIVALEKAMKELEKNTRECYSEKFDALNRDEFVRMMVLDGCFIVELIRLHEYATTHKVDDPIFLSRFMLIVVGQDLLMLENQLPLFVLHKLFALTGPNKDKASFNVLAIKFFNTLVPGRKENTIPVQNVATKEHLHLLALFHSSFITINAFLRTEQTTTLSSSEEGGPVKVPKTWWFSSATVLRCAGISFKKKDDGVFLDKITFVNKVLEIPPLYLNTGLTLFLRNAVAYEQCNTRADPYFTTLVIFFRNLVGSPKEVEILRGREIIRTLYSNEEAADVLHKLAKGIVHGLEECCMLEVIKKINDFTEKRWIFWKATLNLYYFVNQEPINLLLLYLTIIQTISSVYQIIQGSIDPKKKD